jgi:peroxiredoxin
MRRMSRGYWLQTAIAVLFIGCMSYVVWAAWAERSGDSRQRAEAGENAPDFELMKLDGQQMRLSDYRGQAVLLNFWASWCTLCVNELPLMNEAYKLNQTTDSKVEIIAVNIGEKPETIEKFVHRYELLFPIVLDGDNVLKKTYHISSLPLTLLIDQQGNIVERHVGELDDMAVILDKMQQVLGAASAS